MIYTCSTFHPGPRFQAKAQGGGTQVVPQSSGDKAGSPEARVARVHRIRMEKVAQREDSKDQHRVSLENSAGLRSAQV